MAALRASEPIEALHFSQSGQQALVVGVLQQAAELLNSRRPSHEDLHAAGIANQIGFVFLGNSYLPRLRTYGTREHRFAAHSYHRIDLRTS
jgi:hypothetical protein